MQINAISFILQLESPVLYITVYDYKIRLSFAHALAHCTQYCSSFLQSNDL